MKSIQSKIISVIFAAIVVSAITIGGIGIVNFKRASNQNSIEIMNLTCREQALELNNVFGRIEQSVEIMAVHAVDALESVERLSTDAAYLEDFTRHIDELGLTIASETSGAYAIYIRFNPEITSPQAGFFRVKDGVTGKFEKHALTDFTKYNADDIGHVGWYYVPVQKKKAVWMPLYYNQNVDISMISYVVPIYKENMLIGIVGMDIDFEFIQKQVDDIHVYDTGHAFLTDENFCIVYGRHFEKGMQVGELSKELARADGLELTGKDTLYDYTHDKKEQKVAFTTLDNGMCLAVTVAAEEINSAQNTYVLQMIVLTIVVVIAFVLIAGAIARTIIYPLRTLNTAAQEIAKGNLEVSMECNSKDELGTLAGSFRETVKQLKLRIDYINSLAFIDKLTGVKNNTSYLHEVAELKIQLRENKVPFAVFVVDVNGLKGINDQYGHYYGNKLIIEASKLVATVFGHENVYRIGGDEFAVLIPQADAEICEAFEESFAEALQNRSGGIRLSAAIGSAVFNPAIDSSYENVFQRADTKMYQRKQEMKAQGETSRIERLQGAHSETEKQMQIRI
ncbi:MAG: diguanylate cyclase [Lachnospiraceae bacterium]|nr:diguanylate cyclase [Lachnospiraceae bacterium]